MLKMCDFKFEKYNNPIIKYLALKVEDLEQKMLLHLLLDEDIRCLTIVAPSGKGKTVLTTDVALAALKASKEKETEMTYDQFIYAKPLSAISKDEALGFYPGTLEEKLTPHVQSIFDAIESIKKAEIKKKHPSTVVTPLSVREFIERQREIGEIEILPLAHIRGRNIANKFSVLDEGQNTTNHIMKSFLTRHMDSSKTIITGDIDQIDDPNLHKFNTGLTHLVEQGKEEPYIAHLTMDITPISKRGKLATFGSNKL